MFDQVSGHRGPVQLTPKIYPQKHETRAERGERLYLVLAGFCLKIKILTGFYVPFA